MTDPRTSPPARPDHPRGRAFDDLARSYNFRYAGERSHIFTDLLVDECRRLARPSRVLDIGCGGGIECDLGLTRRVSEACDELWGVEPDPKMPEPPGIFASYQHALLETAAIPDASIDLAYSFMVMEHVQDPEGFMRAVHRVLKPGGVYMFMTINARHYFARLAGTLRRIKADEGLLRLLRGKREVEEYHYPVAYKINRPETIEPVARAVGFETPSYVFMEKNGPEPYLKGPLRPVLWAMNWKRGVVKNPRALLELVCRVRKPA
ncbi:MAG: class I SAM-dependent methyltransferase [Phycisphaeraceae bacterium]|nr:MAG: class I SAM-dependent methyltransferase [Phycisphaeraceae bacterium]